MPDEQKQTPPPAQVVDPAVSANPQTVNAGEIDSIQINAPPQAFWMADPPGDD
jgi:hypothetical protein